MSPRLPERHFVPDLGSLLDKLTRDYDTMPEPLPKNLLEFLTRHGVIGRISEAMIYPIEPQIVGEPKTRFSFPKYREPNAQIDITPEAGPLPRDVEHYCLNPNDGTEDWFYLICLFEAWENLPLDQKLALIAARLNEKPSS